MEPSVYFKILPEIFLLLSGCFILLVGAFSCPSIMSANKIQNCSNKIYILSVLALLVLAAWFFIQYVNIPGILGIFSLEDNLNISSFTSHKIFNEMFIYDSLSNLLKAAAVLATLFSVIYSKAYLNARGLLRANYCVLVLLALFGQCVMISAGHFLSLYLGLELLALSSYALIAIERDCVISTEAAVKYFILSALASGLLLYGLSMLYGASGSLVISEVLIAANLEAQDLTKGKLIWVMGLVFAVSGLAFKLGVAPFHMWVPDVYQGSPNPIALLLASASKLAAVAIIFRLLIGGLSSLAASWQPMLLIMAVLSLLVGNITAIAQTNFKRLLAYSAIAHMGFILLAIASAKIVKSSDFDIGVNEISAYSAALFYILIYVLTTLGSFGLILRLSNYKIETISDLQGLNQSEPWLALMILIIMLSLAGIPLTAGFVAKFSVLQALIAANLAEIAILAVLASLVGTFYYLRIIKIMYFEPTKEIEVTETNQIISFEKNSKIFNFLFSLNGLLLLLIGIIPGWLLDICTKTIVLSIYR